MPAVLGTAVYQAWRAQARIGGCGAGYAESVYVCGEAFRLLASVCIYQRQILDAAQAQAVC